MQLCSSTNTIRKNWKISITNILVKERSEMSALFLRNPVEGDKMSNENLLLAASGQRLVRKDVI